MNILWHYYIPVIKLQNQLPQHNYIAEEVDYYLILMS